MSSSGRLIEFFRLKANSNVVVRLIDKESVEFHKWAWEGNEAPRSCVEQRNYKPITEDFYEKFEQITSEQFNDVWGKNLEKA